MLIILSPGSSRFSVTLGHCLGVVAQLLGDWAVAPAFELVGKEGLASPGQMPALGK